MKGEWGAFALYSLVEHKLGDTKFKSMIGLISFLIVAAVTLPILFLMEKKEKKHE